MNPNIKYKIFPVKSAVHWIWTVELFLLCWNADASEHYHIQSQQPAEQKIAENLETFRRYWVKMFETVKEPASANTIVIARSKEEYVRSLRNAAPDIARTNGYYDLQTGIVYCYSGHANFERTLYHECTHQLFGKVPADSNYWLYEGVALVMESFDAKTNTADDIRNNRFYAAKVYHFQHNYRLPIQQLVLMTRLDWQRQRDIVKLYDQSAALTYMLMFSENGKYRPAILQLLRDFYSGTATADSLPKLTKLSFGELEKKYEAFLRTVPDE